MEEEARNFNAFVKLVRESLEEHAARKGYSKAKIDDPNPLYEGEIAIGAEPGHSVGEIRYKAAEYIEEPREVLPVKMAGWAYLLWRYTPTLRKKRQL
jgi:hypothetical protein